MNTATRHSSYAGQSRKTTHLLTTTVVTFLIALQPLLSQITLPINNTWETSSLTAEDLIIPSDAALITVETRGGDGGTISIRGSICGNPVIKGGSGATMKATFPVGNGDNELRPGGLLRVFTGQAGGSTDKVCANGNNHCAGGGGSSAILYKALPSAGQWTLLSVAGGGGGANRPYAGAKYDGMGANAGEGGDSVENSNGGTDGDCGADIIFLGNRKGYGGAGYKCRSVSTSQPDPQKGKSMAYNTVGSVANGIDVSLASNTLATQTGGKQGEDTDGGNGFTGGAAGHGGGGGGGGFSGGAGKSILPGGGGGSYLDANHHAFDIVKTSGQNGAGAQRNGAVKINTATLPPIARCHQRLLIDLNADGQATITFSSIDDGSFIPNGSKLRLFNKDDNTVMSNPTVFTCAQASGRVRVALQILDQSDNIQEECTTVIYIFDETPPTPDVPDLPTIYGECTVALPTAPTATDKCSGLITGKTDGPLLYPLGTHTVTWVYDDGLGNTTTQLQTLIVSADRTPPVARCRNFSIPVNAEGEASINAADLDDGSSDNCGPVNLSFHNGSSTQVIVDCYEGTPPLTLRVTDETGNYSTCTSTVQLIDAIPPVAKCKDVTVELDADGLGSVSALDLNDWSFDNCSDVDISFTDGSTEMHFDCSDDPIIRTVFLSVKDDSGNESFCSGKVDIHDPIPPVARCKDITLKLDENGLAEYSPSLINDGSSDNCQANSPLSIYYLTCNDIGSFTETFSVSDPSGNSASCTGLVMVVDNIAPIAKCRNYTVYLDANGQGSVSTDDLDNGTSDNCGPVQLTFVDGTTEQFFDCGGAGGSLTVPILAKDASGNESICFTNVYIVDDIPPTIQTLNLIVELDDNGQANISAEDIDRGSRDNCGIVSMSLDRTSFDCADVGPHTLTLSVRDGAGNTATATVLVTIEDQVESVCTSRLSVRPKVFLQGPFSSGLMSDGLRTAGLIPTTEPYTSLGFTHRGQGGGETVSSAVLQLSGNNAIVDWVFLELQSEAGSPVATRSALLQRDGDIVDTDGTSAVTFSDMDAGNYYLVVHHRNHLGIRTANPLSLSDSPVDYDFTTALTRAGQDPTVTSNAPMVDLGGAVYGLFRSDSNADGNVNIVDFIQVKSAGTPNQGGVYHGADLNLDGNVNIIDLIQVKDASTPNKSAHLN